MRIYGYLEEILPPKVNSDYPKSNDIYGKLVVFDRIIAILTDWTEASYQDRKRRGKPMDF